MWLIKRVLVDGWNVDRAMEEATALGLAGEAMRKFALAEIETRRK
jgi:hypothetical protein